MSKDNGGPAFSGNGMHIVYVPDGSIDEVKETVEKLQEKHSGMTLRDYFAAQALPACLPVATKVTSPDFVPEIAAHYAYALADAMLAERAK